MSAEALTLDGAIAGYREQKISRGKLIAALTLAGATAAGAAVFVSSIDNSHGTPTNSATAGHVRGVDHNAQAASTSQVSMHESHIEAQTMGH